MKNFLLRQHSRSVFQGIGVVPAPRARLFIVGVSRGNTIRGNRTERKSASERVSERISEREGFRGFQRFAEVFRGFERFSEVKILELFRAFQRFSEVFQRPSQRPSQSAIFPSVLRVVLPLIVLPLKTPAILVKERQKGGGREGGPKNLLRLFLRNNLTRL